MKSLPDNWPFIRLHLGLLMLATMSCADIEYRKGAVHRPTHHTEHGFRNPHVRSDRGFADFLRWQLDLAPEEDPPVSPEAIPKYEPQITAPDWSRIRHPQPHRMQVTWVGHATFLVQIGGMNILTDPIFSERCSPVSFVGPKRVVPPALPLAELPPIDAVVISHNHYDHLDASTIDRLGNRPRYFVPLGLKAWLAERKISNVTELDWWQPAPLGALTVHCVPARHFSGRSLFDRNETLWAGWVMASTDDRLFFAGDTGYSPHFAQIGERLGPMTLALIPIGAYRPRWFMSPVHVDPPQAVQIHQDVHAERSIGMHWGTFKLTDEPLGEPPIYLRQALQEVGLGDEAFTVMKFGETRAF